MDNRAKQRQIGLDFARAFGALGIVAYHFYCHSSSTHKLFFAYANGGLGIALNYLFFMLSGLVVQMRYGNAADWSVGSFYYKRWKTLIPPYVIAFSFPFLMTVLSVGKVFYMDIPKWRLLLTFFGLDGYATMIFPTYFITGEWFLGAIVIAYLVYPGLRFLIHRAKYLTLTVLALLSVITLKTGLGEINEFANPFVSLLCFYMGMSLTTLFPYFRKPGVIFGGGGLLCVLLLVPLGGPVVAKEIMTSCALLVVAYNIGELLCRNPLVRRFTLFVSGISYYSFLIHHRIIYRVLQGYDRGNTVAAAAVLLGVIVITFVFSTILKIIMDHVYACKLFEMVEQRLFAKQRIIKA